MSVKIRVFGKIVEENGRFYVPFTSYVKGEVPETSVSLARKPDHCFFGLGTLENHDDHMPSFATVEDAEAYRRRVLCDFLSQLNGEIATIGLYDGTTPAYMPPIKFGG